MCQPAASLGVLAVACLPQSDEDGVDEHGFDEVLVGQLLLLLGVPVVRDDALVQQGVPPLSPPASPAVSLGEARLLVVLEPVCAHVVELVVFAVAERVRVGAVCARGIVAFFGNVVRRAACVLLGVCSCGESGAGERGRASSGSSRVLIRHGNGGRVEAFGDLGGKGEARAYIRVV